MIEMEKIHPELTAKFFSGDFFKILLFEFFLKFKPFMKYAG